MSFECNPDIETCAPETLVCEEPSYPPESVSSSEPENASETTVVDESMVQTAVDEFAREVESGLSDISVDQDQLSSWAETLLQDGEVSVQLRFSESELPIEGATPDLETIEDALIQGSATLVDGNVYFLGEPILGCGFRSTHPFFIIADGKPLRINSAEWDEDGQVFFSANNPIAGVILSDLFNKYVLGSKDETFYTRVLSFFSSKEEEEKAAEESTVWRELFPNGRIEPVPVERLFDVFVPRLLEKKEPEEKPAFGDLFAKAIKEVAVVAQFYLDDSTKGADAPWIGVNLSLDPHELMTTFEEGGFRNFDFDGIKRGSSVDWFNIDLSSIPLPPEISISGSADLHVRRSCPDSLDIAIENLHAEVYLEDRFENEPVTLRGNITFTLIEGGGLRVNFGQLYVNLPSIPSGQEAIASLSGTVSGDVSMDLHPDRGISAPTKAHIDVSRINAATKEGKSIRLGNNGPAVAGSIRGDIGVDYTPWCACEELKLRWNIEADGLVQVSDQLIGLSNLHSEGDGGFNLVDEKYVPNFGNANVFVESDAVVGGKDGPSVSAQNLKLQLEGTGSRPENRGVRQTANLSLSADDVRVGSFSFRPSIDEYHLSSYHDDERYELQGGGLVTVEADSPRLVLQSDIAFLTDLEDLSLIATFGDQIIGPASAQGRMNLRAEGSFPLDSVESVFRSFEIKTNNPYRIDVNGENIINGLTVSGKGDAGRTHLKIEVPSIMDRAEASLSVRGNRGSRYLRGEYHVESKPFDLSKVSLENAEVTGTFKTRRLARFLKKPQISLSGLASFQTEGVISGPVLAEVNVTLIPRFFLRNYPFALRIVFDPETESFADLGPFASDALPPELSGISGKTNLIGMLEVGFKNRMRLRKGDDVGLEHGFVWGIDADGEEVLLVEDLTFKADRLRGIRHGALLCAGDGCWLTAEIHPSFLSLFGWTSADELPRSIEWRRRLFPLSLEAIERNFVRQAARRLKKIEDKERGGL